MLTRAADGDNKSFWNQVNRVMGKSKETKLSDINPTTLNDHYASISTDQGYLPPEHKITCTENCSCKIEEITVFRELSKIKSTAHGPDNLPWWFLKFGAPGLSKPLTYLFNLSLEKSYVPEQWKKSCIKPIPKVSNPTQCSDYRPISLTSIVSRLMEKIITRHFIYPTFAIHPISNTLVNQFAFRPSGSTTAALISITNDITSILETDECVHVIALDFSKAFDTVRHHSFFLKLAKLPIPDFLYNWYISYFSNRNHQTKINDGTFSDFKPINASIVQGSAIGPTAFIITASDLKTITPGNKLDKYADDTYLIVPGKNTNSIAAELSNISDWAKQNNLSLNKNKTKELIITKSGIKNFVPPPPTTGIERVDQLDILGVVVNSKLSYTDHIARLLNQSHQKLYGLKILKNHGLPLNKITEVTRSILVSRLVYASPAWYGFIHNTEFDKMKSIINKAKKWGLYSNSAPSLEDIIDQADRRLFKNIITNKNHVLYPLLPPQTQFPYNLRQRKHNYTLPTKTTLSIKNFVIRMLYNNFGI